MRNVRDYALVTACYWAFTLTDGALRMLVLLHLNRLGYAPLEIASLFLLYEVFGVVTNGAGGWLGARFGLKATLFAGLALQVVALSMMTVPVAWLVVPYVMVAQGLSGVAKDLTKMSSKSWIRLVVPEGDAHGLMRWVALLTGSKNTLKGIGFFLGGLLLAVLGFQTACATLAGLVGGALLVAWVTLPREPGRASAKVPFRAILSDDARINWLSAARLFLFGSRDVWFVLALPLFLADALGWGFSAVGGFLALWVIGYGIVQALAPRYVRRGAEPADAAQAGRWTALLLVPLAGILLALYLGAPPAPVLVAGLALFGFVFASDSAIHSFLIVRYAAGDKVSLAVGFYYMANAAGRLAGTVLGGALFQWAGLGGSGLRACLVGSIAFVAISALFTLPLQRAEANVVRPRGGGSRL